ncbi:MAG: hypothetical protein J0M20_10695 [Burkholderiales bacterium]|nr:hypothetical protein [Burkholderiales bacterium]
MTPRFFWALLPGTLLLASSALAAPMLPDGLQRFPPEMRAKVVQRLAAQQRQAPRNASLDGTPPRITAFSVEATVVAHRQESGLGVDISVADDWSGVKWLNVEWTHLDSGIRADTMVFVGGASTARREQGRLQLSPVWGMGGQPGSYVISGATVADVAGNVAHYGQAELAALGGNLGFEVRNRLYDPRPPVLRAGRLGVSSVSRSTPWSGTADAMPMVTAELTVGDKGSGPLAGVVDAHFYMCTLDETDCLLVIGTQLPRHGRSVMQLSGTVLPEQTLGTYHLANMFLYDRSGNFTVLSSKRFGGDTDFSRYFPATQVEITP